MSPLEAGLGFAIDWSKEFIGKAALETKNAEGVESRIVTIVLDDLDAMPLGNEPVLFEDKVVGKTTSAAFGFRIGAPIAIADIGDRVFRADGASVQINIAEELYQGRVVVGAAFDPKGSRMRTRS
jgi:4-methylaminobutanoate oxidase (formaldehyde-forming)